ncbi:protein [Escherichia coli]|uniref:Protein n=1 Tax=Escherichia coli TaxID=562 RepID=A0A377D1T8_ECOLX|nr:protein [Escherichia coli]
MFRSLFLAAALMAFTPLAANAGEITLLPSIKLQIGDRDHTVITGTVVTGEIVITGIAIMSGAKNRWWRHDNGYHRGWDKRKSV